MSHMTKCSEISAVSQLQQESKKLNLIFKWC